MESAGFLFDLSEFAGFLFEFAEHSIKVAADIDWLEVHMDLLRRRERIGRGQENRFLRRHSEGDSGLGDGSAVDLIFDAINSFVGNPQALTKKAFFSLCLLKRILSPGLHRRCACSHAVGGKCDRGVRAREVLLIARRRAGTCRGEAFSSVGR
jgi:hypothetical protein